SVESAGHPPAVQFDSGTGAWRVSAAKGVVLGVGARGPDALAAGLAWAAAVVRQPGGRLPDLRDVGRDGVRVRRAPGRDRPLPA
ncbi:hypothetical protein, partial [Actinomadura roseirufa]|uniref:hypothetical protein n=1 Tax=Actinomadura roseirufa TaxID=2094049 RepID=UPI001A954C41